MFVENLIVIITQIEIRILVIDFNYNFFLFDLANFGLEDNIFTRQNLNQYIKNKKRN